MARLKTKGKAGAAKAYVTRTAAIKKLQCTLADFRRLCILKGIFPREPRHKKKANKGSTAPTSFYYAKDIAYLAHEPVLQKLREHKAFAKKLARAMGRGEWSDAKRLDENKPTYRLDHIIKERYPTFIDAVRDIDDALCMIFLFASLPSEHKVTASLVANCSRFASEWMLYVMHTHSLRKTFFSIKGIYYQAEVMDQTVTWLIPYQFTSNIPTDVDVRVMLTFLELYQTLLGFVFFKLYTDAGLSYPPPLDASKDDAGAGVGAFSLQDATNTTSAQASTSSKTQSNAKGVTTKDVRQTIKSINVTSGEDVEMPLAEETAATEEDEDFVVQPSTTNPEGNDSLTTLKTITSLPQAVSTRLFSPYTFYISRETSRPIFEFLVRSFGGRVGWAASVGSGSPVEEDDDTITHVIIDRPVIEKPNETSEQRQRRLRRKYVQPQWIADCINAGKILPEESYLQGKTLPPHLSPFGERQDAYDPTAEREAVAEDEDEEESEIEGEDLPDEEDEDEILEDDLTTTASRPAKRSKVTTPRISADDAGDAEALRVAELAAEAAGMDYGDFEKQVNKAQRKSKKDGKAVTAEDSEQDMNKMLMSNRQRKLYEKMKYGERKRQAEKDDLDKKRTLLDKAQRQKQK